MKKHFIYILIVSFLFACSKNEEKKENGDSMISTSKGFPISEKGKSTTIYLSDNEFIGVKKIAQKFQNDIEKVTNIKPELVSGKLPSDGPAIIVGTIGNSALIDKLIAENKLDVTSIKGKWETFIIETIKEPFEGINEALVIVGSDKRGTIYGMFDLSYEMGVSPLYFWCDVPVKKKENVFLVRGSHTKGTPKVKYRGIFINDEAPSLTNWVYSKYGGFNADFYDHVFELILRLKGNYLWPAMWPPRAFYVDDPKNGIVANEYGIVMGTSHHEPLARAHAEWKPPFAKGHWNYKTNAAELETFWKGGMERAKNWESLITVGMRGDGDEAMSEDTATELLETIVEKQREIIADVTGKPANETPQMWALYKEVMDYYDKGMRVPDDVTVLLCDDNWGNIRKLPALDAEPRAGGYGIYYHFDYVGGPRNYKWINTNQIERVWEQMHLAYQHNVDRIWVVNVGDIKPMEFPIAFFLDYAWDPDKWTPDNLQDYYTQWAAKQFGDAYADDISYLLKTYTKYNARRKHELLNIPAYSLTHFNEADTMLADFKALEVKALEVKQKLPKEYLNAYYHLVEHPIIASSNLNELYIAAFKNKFYAEKGNPIANEYAQKVKDLYIKDSLITKYYHEELADGKWNGIMSQTHIGYTNWQQPPNNIIPETVLVNEAEILEKENTPEVSANAPELAKDVPNDAKGFIEGNGYISIEAHNFSGKSEPEPFQWKIIDNLGKTGSSVISLPIKEGRIELNKKTPKLSYNVYFKNTGKIKVHTYFAPTLNYSTREGMYFGLSFDDEKPVKVNYDSDSSIFNYNGKVPANWHNNVSNSIKIISTEFEIKEAGNHTLNYFRVDEGLVLQKIVIETGENKLPDSYLGPPQSSYKK